MNQQPMMQNPRPAVSKWLWIILIIVAVIGAGFFSWYFLMGPGKKVTTTTTPVTTTDKTAGWQTFENKTYGYSFKYPKTLYLTNGLHVKNTDNLTATDKWVFLEPKQDTSKNYIADGDFPSPYFEIITTDTEVKNLMSDETGATKSQITFAGEQAVKTILTQPSAFDGSYTENISFNHAGKGYIISWKNSDAKGTHDANIDTLLTTFKFTTVTTSATTPEKLAENFYNYYLGLVNRNGQTNSQGKFQSTATPYKLKAGFSDYLTATLISNLESLFNDATTNADPILCAQDIPTKITYDTATITNTTATSVVNMQFTPVTKVTLGYVKDGNNWKINSITCQ